MLERALFFNARSFYIKFRLYKKGIKRKHNKSMSEKTEELQTSFNVDALIRNEKNNLLLLQKKNLYFIIRYYLRLNLSF